MRVLCENQNWYNYRVQVEYAVHSMNQKSIFYLRMKNEGMKVFGVNKKKRTNFFSFCRVSPGTMFSNKVSKIFWEILIHFEHSLLPTKSDFRNYSGSNS